MAVAIILFVLLFLCIGIALLGQVLFAVGINNDAKGNYNPNPIMWALLVGFVGWIPAIIYFCTRKNNVMIVGCPHCRSILPEPLGQCPFCSQATNLIPEDPAYVAWRKRGKKQMIWGAVLYGAGFVLYFVLYILFFLTMLALSGN